MSIPGLDWGMDEVMQKDLKKPPTKKVPYAKPIPAQFQQVSKSLKALSEPSQTLKLYCMVSDRWSCLV